MDDRGTCRHSARVTFVAAFAKHRGSNMAIRESSVTLEQLFACVGRGKILVAEAADKRLVSIDEVPSGLACRCICSGCDRPMVAKKGKIKRHHFAHDTRRDDHSCVSAGETALHKFAKQVLGERLEIELPELFVGIGNDKEVLVKRDRWSFERAVLETKQGLIVPDVTIYKRDRSLIVEFKVTHACDEQKIARIRDMDVGAIEIDLSPYLKHSFSELGDAILYRAPRVWLHNPRERAAHERLSEKARKREEDRAKLVQQLRSAYRHRLPSNTAGGGKHESLARRDGLGDAINLPVDGSGCFTVGVAEWQAALLLGLLDASAQPFRTRSALAIVRRRGWLSSTFEGVSAEIAKAIQSTDVPFASPTQAVEAYLARLEQLGFVRAGGSETWQATAGLTDLVEASRELQARPAKRLNEVRRLVEKGLASLPAEETDFFSFDEWATNKLPERGYSVREAVLFGQAEWERLISELANVARLAPRQSTDLMGLPFGPALKRELERTHHEAEERQRAARAKLDAESASRVSRIRNGACERIGEEAETWLRSPNIRIGGTSPLEAAAKSEDGYLSAFRALELRVREIEIQGRARCQKEQAIAGLRSVVSCHLDPDHTALWMRSPHPKLGRLSPEKFTVDDATRDQCIALLRDALPRNKRARRWS